MTDENDSDEILTQGWLSTEVIEREMPFALSTAVAAPLLNYPIMGYKQYTCGNLL